MLKWIPCLFGAAGALVLGAWLRAGPSVPVVCRIPEATSGGQGAGRNAGQGPTGQLTLGSGKPAELPGDWPCFRGKQRDNVCTDGVRLARSWPAGGPQVLWALDVGEGHAGAAVWSGRVFILDYDRERQADTLRCLSLADGAELWRYSYPVAVKRNHGMSRTVPAVTEKYVVALGPKCHVTCLESTSGKFLWSKDLVAEFGTVVPPWYAGQCPLIEDEKAILAPGGDALLAAVDCASGKVLWRTPNPHGWNMTHSSVAPMSFEGSRIYVYSGSGGVVGVSGETGEVLWETETWLRLGDSSLAALRAAKVPDPVLSKLNAMKKTEFVTREQFLRELGKALNKDEFERFKDLALNNAETDAWTIKIATVATPVPVDDERLFLSGGYGAGSMMLGLKVADGKPKPEPLFRLKEGVFGAAQQTPILYEERIYGVRPNGELACLDPDGKVLWTSGTAHRFGLGPLLIADGLILVLADNGKLTLAEAGSSEFKLLAQAQVLPGHDAWAPLALAGGRLIARDLTRMVCLDLAEPKK